MPFQIAPAEPPMKSDEAIDFLDVITESLTDLLSMDETASFQTNLKNRTLGVHFSNNGLEATALADRFLELMGNSGLLSVLPLKMVPQGGMLNDSRDQLITHLTSAMAYGENYMRGNVRFRMLSDGSCSITLRHGLTPAKLVAALGDKHDIRQKITVKQQQVRAGVLAGYSPDDIMDSIVGFQPPFYPDDAEACCHLAASRLSHDIPNTMIYPHYEAVSSYGTYHPVLQLVLEPHESIPKEEWAMWQWETDALLNHLVENVQGAEPTEVLAYASGQQGDLPAFVVSIPECPSRLKPKLRQWAAEVLVEPHHKVDEIGAIARLDEHHAAAALPKLAEQVGAWFRKHHPRLAIDSVEASSAMYQGSYDLDRRTSTIAERDMDQWLAEFPAARREAESNELSFFRQDAHDQAANVLVRITLPKLDTPDAMAVFHKKMLGIVCEWLVEGEEIVAQATFVPPKPGTALAAGELPPFGIVIVGNSNSIERVAAGNSKYRGS